MLRRLPALAWTTDKQMRIASAGGSGAGDLHEDFSAMVGRPITRCFGRTWEPDSPLVAAHRQALAGTPATVDHVWNRKAYRLYIEPLVSSGNRIEGCIGMAIDITPRKVQDPHGCAVHGEATEPVEQVENVKHVCHLISQEVEERRRAEATLRDNHERLQQLAASIESAFWIEEVATSRIVYLSPGYEKIWGVTVEEALGSPGHPIWSTLDDDATGFSVADFDGEGNRPWSKEMRIRRADGTVRWIRARGFPIRGAAGQIERLAGVAEDISLHKEEEERARRAERLATLGNFVAGIAHEINNPLGAALAATQAAIRVSQNSDQPLLRESLNQSLASLRRCADVVRSLLCFCRDEHTTECEFDLRDVLNAAVSISQSYAADHRCQLQLDPYRLPLTVRGSALEMELVFVNLIRNAIEAGADRVVVHGKHVVGGIEAVVTDNGCGIPPENAWRVCDPFFSTKMKSGGTGLGLSLVHGIVRQHGGRIEFASLGRGTAVSVLIPQPTTSES